MGFFSDLKEDLSQVMNELLPENASPPSEDEQTAKEALTADEVLNASAQELPSEEKHEQDKEDSAADSMNLDGLKISLEEMLANLDENVQLPEEMEEAESANSAETFAETPWSGPEDIDRSEQEAALEEAKQPEKESADSFGQEEIPEETGRSEWTQDTLSENESPEMATLLQQVLEGNFTEDPEALDGESSEEFVAEGMTDKMSTAEGLEEVMTAVNMQALVEELAEEAEEETPLEAFAEVPPGEVAAFAEGYYSEDTAEAFAEEAEVEAIEETLKEETAAEMLEESLAEEAMPDVVETADENISEESVEENETEVINNNQEVEEQMEEQMNDMEYAQTEEFTEENAENQTEDQSEESKGEGIHMEIGTREAVDETSIITEGMQITGDIVSEGSIEVIGTVVGNIDALGKLNITGNINGNSKAAEIYAEGAKINGEVISEGAVKIGASSVIIGNITATSAAIAGAVKGDIDVHGPVILDASAIVMGNIKSKSVQINNGAVIEGMCSQCYADVSPTSFFDEYKPEPRKSKNK